jgi:hypothetical protein
MHSIEERTTLAELDGVVTAARGGVNFAASSARWGKP